MEKYIKENHVQSVIRALDIIDVLNEPPFEWGSNEIARKTGLATSTTNRLLRTLESRGYVYQNPKTGKYKLGLKLMDLNCQWAHCLELKENALHFMEKLSEETRETICLGILDKKEIIHIARVESPEVLKADIKQFRITAVSSAIGKYLYAWLPKKQIDLLIPPVLTKKTPNTITSLAELKKEFEKIRELNYAMDNEEGFEGVRCIATGICDRLGNKKAGISIIAPANRFPDSKIPVYRDLLFEVANKISKKI